MARAHFQRQQRARELRAEGKDLFEIEHMLGVSRRRVRKYLTAKEK
jgi:predicted transcriptional regulator